MQIEERLRAEIGCLERRRQMLVFAKAGEIMRDLAPLPTDPLIALGVLSTTGPLDLLDSEAEHTRIRSAALRTRLADATDPRSQ